MEEMKERSLTRAGLRFLLVSIWLGLRAVRVAGTYIITLQNDHLVSKATKTAGHIAKNLHEILIIVRFIIDLP